jgi:hypothetical protein
MGGMGEILAALFIPAAVFALIVWALHRWFRRYEGYLPDLGIVIESETQLDAIAPMIGTYHGDEIHEWVRYHGERYDFSHVAPRGRLRLGRDELFLAPGLVYRRYNPRLPAVPHTAK